MAVYLGEGYCDSYTRLTGENRITYQERVNVAEKQFRLVFPGLDQILIAQGSTAAWRACHNFVQRQEIILRDMLYGYLRKKVQEQYLLERPDFWKMHKVTYDNNVKHPLSQ